MHRTPLADPSGVRLTPDCETGDGVLVLAGSSGRIDEARARLFAGIGCVTEAIRWFGGPGQHDSPWEIPLETFFTRIDDLKTVCDRVYVVGMSFGAEAALLCGALSDSVAGVAAFAPSDVVWAGYDPDGRETSRWTVGGSPLPFVPIDTHREEAETGGQPRYRQLYERSRRNHADQLLEATIPVHRIEKVVLVAGDDDQVWPSVVQAQRIRALREAHGRTTALITDPEAGHRTILPGEPVVTTGIAMCRGGTEPADRRLGDHAWAAVTDMLRSSR